jgi:hypothetical protein
MGIISREKLISKENRIAYWTIRVVTLLALLYVIIFL